MKKINLFLITIFLITVTFSCQEKKKNNKPIFLSFSPEMTDSEFENEIKEKTWDKTLESGKFIIELNSKKYKFKLEKGEKSINLFYKESEFKNIKFLNIEKSKEIIKKQKILMNSLIQIFRNKSEYIESEMPKLKESRAELYLFRSKEKSVLLTFIRSGDIIRSPKEQAKYNNKLRRENPNSLVGLTLSSSTLDILGIKLKTDEYYLNYMQISYYSNQEMDKLINSTNKAIYKQTKEEKERIKKLQFEKEMKEMKEMKIQENQKLL